MIRDYSFHFAHIYLIIPVCPPCQVHERKRLSNDSKNHSNPYTLPSDTKISIFIPKKKCEHHFLFYDDMDFSIPLLGDWSNIRVMLPMEYQLCNSKQG